MHSEPCRPGSVLSFLAARASSFGSGPRGCVLPSLLRTQPERVSGSWPYEGCLFMLLPNLPWDSLATHSNRSSCICFEERFSLFTSHSSVCKRCRLNYPYGYGQQRRHLMSAGSDDLSPDSSRGRVWGAGGCAASRSASPPAGAARTALPARGFPAARLGLWT